MRRMRHFWLALLVVGGQGALGACTEDSVYVHLRVDLEGVQSGPSPLGTPLVTLTFLGDGESGSCGPDWGLEGQGWWAADCKDLVFEVPPVETLDRTIRLKPGELFGSGMAVILEVILKVGEGDLGAVVYRRIFRAGFGGGTLELDVTASDILDCQGAKDLDDLLRNKRLGPGQCCGSESCGREILERTEHWCLSDKLHDGAQCSTTVAKP